MWVQSCASPTQWRSEYNVSVLLLLNYLLCFVDLSAPGLFPSPQTHPGLWRYRHELFWRPHSRMPGPGWSGLWTHTGELTCWFFTSWPEKAVINSLYQSASQTVGTEFLLLCVESLSKFTTLSKDTKGAYQLALSLLSNTMKIYDLVKMCIRYHGGERCNVVVYHEVKYVVVSPPYRVRRSTHS